MLRSKDTWGECNGKWDEKFFGSFTTRNFKNLGFRQLVYPHTELLMQIFFVLFDRSF